MFDGVKCQDIVGGNVGPHLLIAALVLALSLFTLG